MSNQNFSKYTIKNIKGTILLEDYGKLHHYITFFSSFWFFFGMEIAFISATKLKLELDLKTENLLDKYLTNVFHSPSRFI